MTDLIHADVPIRAVALTLASLLALAACEKNAGTQQAATSRTRRRACALSTTHRITGSLLIARTRGGGSGDGPIGRATLSGR